MNNIIKSSNDNCKYDYFELKNKLQILLIEDDNIDLDCVSLMVKTGYMHDTVAGIAHFLEHMLFNGTKKFPKENAFMNFISQHGGHTNAFTAHDFTCYFYTINSNAISKSIEMFSDFFINPLLNKDAVNREKEAVDAEHKKNISNDMWRINDILRNVCLPNHPLTKFGTGSSESLNIPDIHSKVKEFFESNYSADHMVSVIITKNKINSIKANIINMFEQIPIRKKYDTIINYDKILNSPKLIKLCPIQNIKKIIMYWDLPSFYNSLSQSPINFICNLLGSEDKHSLHYILMNDGYINEISCSVSIYLKDRCILELNIILTDYGFEKKEYVVNFINSYITFLKNNVNTEHIEKLYNELQTINAFNFKYPTKKSSDDTAIELCRLFNQYKFNIKDLLILEYAYENYKPNVMNNFKNTLELMNCDNVIIIFCSRIYEKFNYKIATEYGTKYILDNFIDNYHINYAFKLNKFNKYISTSEKIIKQSISSIQPIRIRNDKILSYWFPTTKYNTINVFVGIKINLPLTLIDIYTHTQSLLYFNSILNEINYEKYLCNNANYIIDIQLLMGKLYITIFGNSNKIYDVCKLIIDSFFNDKLITSNSFNNAKNLLKLNDNNIKYISPYSKLPLFFNKVMYSSFYDYADRLKIIDKIDLDSVKSNFNKIIKMNDITILTGGNINKTLAHKITNLLHIFITNNKYNYDEFLLDKHKNINKCESIYSKDNENKHETNKAVINYIYITKMKLGQINTWYLNSCLINVLDKIISLDYFDTLRTKEKFGYIAGGSVFSTGDKKYLTKYYSFLVQSPNKSTQEIIDRTDRYMLEFKNILLNYEESKITDIINSLISILESPYNNLIEHCKYLFNQEIECKIFNFDSKEHLINTYKTIKKNDIIDFYHKKFINKKNVIFAI
jgi:insulysin